MSMQCISYWVSKLEPLCAEIETEYLDFIIDQSGLDYSIIPALEEFSPPLQWQSLYLGLPEESLPEIAPLQIRIVLNAPLHTIDDGVQESGQGRQRDRIHCDLLRIAIWLERNL
ncbi:hypothetical protein ACU6ZT_20505 [Klebsiella aerogenes]|nr:hypothetical protein [Klebsiella aerogenes]